jgi:hypothetical protein
MKINENRPVVCLKSVEECFSKIISLLLMLECYSSDDNFFIINFCAKFRSLFKVITLDKWTIFT